MNPAERFFSILEATMPTPGMYGWFHILWLMITAALVLLAIRFGKRATDRQVHNTILITAILVSILEIYKQIVFTFSVGDNGIAADYAWYAFPFQFCSTPMYVGLLAGMIRKGKLSDCLCAYLATYAVFAGLAVMFYPGDVFIDTIGINIQTMVCHGSMIPIGALLYASGRVKVQWRTLLRASMVFIVALGIACVLNEIAYFSGLLNTDTFNMFYVSRHCDPHLPVYSLIQSLLPFPLELLVYIFGFTAAASIMMLIPALCTQKMHKSKEIV